MSNPDSPWSSLVCLLWWSSIVSSFFLEVKCFQNHSLLSFSFPLLILFYFLSSMLLEFKKLRCLIKTKLENITQTIVQGSSPWATLILTSVFVVVVLYCVQIFFGSSFFQNHSLLDCSFPLLTLFSFFSGTTMGFSMGCQWYFNGIPMGLQKDAYGISIGFLCDFHDVSMIVVEDFYGISKGMLWEFPLVSYETSMVFLCCFYGISLGFLCGSCGIPVGAPWCFYGISMGLLWDVNWK